MPWYEFIWDDENEEHLEQHGVTPEEFVEVVCDPDRVGAKQVVRPTDGIWTDVHG